MTDRGVILASNGDYWHAVWRDSAGVRRRKSLGPKAEVTRAAAQRECRKLEAEQIVNPAKRNGGKAPSLEDWKEQYFRIRAGEIKDGTATLHRQTFGKLFERFGMSLRLDSITKAAASEFRAWLCEQPNGRDKDKTIGPVAVSRHIRDCKVIFGTAHKLDIVAENPFSHIRAGPNVASDWVYISELELGKILDACPSDTWRRAFALARLVGMRRGEIMRLRWADVGDQWIKILPEEINGARLDGTKQRVRTVPVPPKLREILAAGRGEPNDFVCRFPTENVHRDALVIIRRAGLDAYSKPFHTLKKSLASDWLAAGIPVSDVAQWLGDSVEVLMKHYAKFLNGNAKRITGEVDIVEDLRATIARLEAELAATKLPQSTL